LAGLAFEGVTDRSTGYAQLMCGVCGIYNFGSRAPVAQRLLEAMTECMVHRGPDDDGSLLDGDLGLGMRRLSIIDLAGGAQPILSESGDVAVVLNGEIYNFRELRTRLESHGHIFRTKSDTEVVVHAYEEWGLDALDELNGMFGVAIWDARSRKLIVARDPFGVKPVYWWLGDGEFAFASEVRALLRHPVVPRAVNEDALGEYLDLTHVPSPHTAFAQIDSLTPGHAIVVDRDGLRVQRYVSRPAGPAAMTNSEAIDRLRSEIERAVERQMLADVPVGLMLSGGVDSATLGVLMSRNAREPIDTFTVGFEGDFEGNELELARQTSELIGSRHHDVRISSSSYVEFLPWSIRNMEVPVATWQTLPFHRVCELAREHVKVVLTGQGADEPFAGYRRHLGERYGGIYRQIPSALRRRGVEPLVKSLRRAEWAKRSAYALGEHDPLERLRRTYSVIDDDLSHRLLGERAGPPSGTPWLEAWRGDIEEFDSLNKMTYVDARTILSDNLLLYGDKMSMSVSLEARVPYLDRDLMRLAEALPARMKIRGHQQKWVLKAAMRKWLPPEIRSRRKVGFAVPMDEWLRQDLRQHVEDHLLDAGSATARYFDRRVVAQLIAEHAAKRHDHKRILFSLLTFEHWHDQFIRPSSWPPEGQAAPSQLR
jgi:asparagine synthase (glutamine-hydrolysing)